MKVVKHVIILLWAFALSGCNNLSEHSNKLSGKVYVLAPDDRASSFIDQLAVIVRRYKLEPKVGGATDDRGRRLHVLDAKGSNIRLRSENVLLSAQEDASKCGAHDEPYPDPGQYFISVFASGDPDGDESAKKLLGMISSDLRKHGYEVSSIPRLCSGHKG